MEYQWYDTVDSSTPLEQGDIIEGCNVIIPSAKHYQDIESGIDSDNEIAIETINAVVMTQSCDIQHDKIDSVILCPIWSLKEMIAENEYFKSSKAREELRQGKYPSYHLLNTLKTDILSSDFYVVDFHHIYSVRKNLFMPLLQINTARGYYRHIGSIFHKVSPAILCV